MGLSSKESLRRLWHYVYPASDWKFWKRWYFWATHSRLEPIRKAAETVRRHIDNIMTYYRVRNQGTLGGNLCFNDPHTDPGPKFERCSTCYRPEWTLFHKASETGG